MFVVFILIRIFKKYRSVKSLRTTALAYLFEISLSLSSKGFALTFDRKNFFITFLYCHTTSIVTKKLRQLQRQNPALVQVQQILFFRVQFRFRFKK